jgi:predicted DsbA family dithiol-disulfide isomerase
MIIDVWADVVCPWCFIGKRRLEKALSTFPHRDQITVRHRAFQLDPNAKEVLPTSELLESKYNATPDQVRQMQANVCAVADGEGLCYQLDGTLSGNTFDAHRLLLWSASIGKQGELLEALFSAYFEKSRPIFTHADLVSVAVSVGIDADVADDILRSGQYEEEVIEDRNLAAQLGATGVPFFVLNMRYGISGAQPLEAFTGSLEQAWQEYQAQLQ